MTKTSEDAYRHIITESIAFVYPAALRATALLELAEHLADGPRDVADLAGLTGLTGRANRTCGACCVSWPPAGPSGRTRAACST